MSKQIKFSAKTIQRLNEASSSPSHAILILGADGGGSNYLAEQLAESIVDTKSFGSIDTVDGTVDASIEAVRNLQNFLKLSTAGSDQVRRVVIIKRLDSFGTEAQNALLKTTEEPPSDTIIIATAENSHKLLPTLRSRFSELLISPLSLDESMEIYAGSYSEKAIKESHAISAGNSELLYDLLSKPEDHKLPQAIAQAKEILLEDKYTRLLRVDKLSKEEQGVLTLLLSAMQKIIYASLQHSTSLSNQQAQKRISQLEAVISADKHLKANVQPKLVLDSLFTSL